MTAAPPRPLRVAHVGSDPAVRGGMPAVLRGLLESPLSGLHQLEVIPTYRTADRVDRLRVFVLGLLRLARFCLGRGPRLVHVHTAVRGSWYRKAVVVAVAGLLRRPVVLHLHAGKRDIEEFHARLGPVRRRAFRRLFGSADRVISVSAAGAEAIERLFGRGGIVVVPNAAPPVRLPDPGAVPAHDPARPAVLYVGGFEDPAKGGHVLLDALEEVMRRAPEMQVTLAGPGELPEAGRRLVERHPGVRWVGWVDAEGKPELFAAADVFVLPSVSEGLPVALLEAMTYGKAIVATQMGGVPDVMAAGVEGELVPPEDPAALAAAICALAGDAARRDALARAAQARAAGLTPEVVAERLDAIYREVAGA